MSASFPFGVSTPNGIEARASRLRSFLAHPVALASNRRQRICSSFASSNPSNPATQSGLPLTFLRRSGISAVARYFGGGTPVSTDGYRGFNGVRGRCLQGANLTHGFR
jgi:hypothetical protein